ncbi:LLM class flavin-dependent oxidoreductase [Curtobacterium sp. MCJR17_043]|nr:LLM class flavin-dependent oxidoreductase [Curtobacterium sp. MCJR17_043]WIB36071.1 LLM class flavin-dependent oxidoreductase [Curtobacterium sp. MCJR17_043]
MRLLVREAQLAESVGIDVFSIGEHYRPGNVDTATPVLLAAAAQATSTIRLGTAVTVLSTNDPVRLYQAFATVDAVSNGRARVILGRASSVESFSLFGFNMADYDALFEENLNLFVRLMREERVTWSGQHRSPLQGVRLQPRMPEGGYPRLDRHRWQPRVSRPGGALRAPAHDLRRRRTAGTLRRARGPVSAKPRPTRPARAAHRAPRERPHRRNRRGGAGRVLAALGSADDPSQH